MIARGPLHAGLFGDAATDARLSDAAEIAAMVEVERALARACARAGLAPEAAAAEIDATLAGAAPSPASLAEGTAADGVPVPALVRALRDRLAPEAAHWLHWGATSHDVADCALVIRLLPILDDWQARRRALVQRLADLAEAHLGTPMAGRTRTQIATPISFGLRAAQWLQPLLDLGERAGPLRARLGRVQFGGAAGSNSAVHPHGPALAAALAAELGLADAPPWHTSRGAVAELGGWCADFAAALAKPAADLALMARRESGEARGGASGGSSTMPQKANPVTAEALLALARQAAALAAPLHLAALAQEERDGAAWMGEWLALPPLLSATGGALARAEELAATLTPDPARMAAALELDGGAALAETASFALSAHLPRAEAVAAVKTAVAAARDRGRPLREMLAAAHPEVDWRTALDPETALAAARATAAPILDRARRG